MDEETNWEKIQEWLATFAEDQAKGWFGMPFVPPTGVPDAIKNIRTLEPPDNWHWDGRRWVLKDDEGYRGKSYAIPPGPGAHEPGTVTAKDEDPVMKSSELSDFLKENFMANLVDNMRGKDIGQAPGVVAGGGRREFPNMMGQYAPWENRKDYMWLGNTA
jgi:hypothetical protein